MSCTGLPSTAISQSSTAATPSSDSLKMTLPNRESPQHSTVASDAGWLAASQSSTLRIVSPDMFSPMPSRFGDDSTWQCVHA